MRPIVLESALVIGVLTGCQSEECDLRTVAFDLAGAEATDCGDAGTDGDSSAVDACMTASISAGTDAVGLKASAGIDSVISGATVFVDGRLWFLSQDSYVAGSGGPINGWECVGPTVDADSQIACESREPHQNHYLVCGTWSGGETEPLPFPK